MGTARPAIGVIVPTYGHFDYAAAAVESCWQCTNTANIYCLLVDDASPEFYQSGGEVPECIQPLLQHGRNNHAPLRLMRFEQNGGLTRSWNAGLHAFMGTAVDYIVCTNSDVLFTPGWHEPLIAALDCDYALVGPLSNAPGDTAKGEQLVTRYIGYAPTDSPESLARVAELLRARYRNTTIASPINGFFMMARKESWYKGAWSQGSGHVFRPVNALNSRGQLNPTPLMTLNEDELQERWRKLGMRSAIALDSFILHYRAVSRGDKHRRDLWLRRR